MFFPRVVLTALLSANAVLFAQSAPDAASLKLLLDRVSSSAMRYEGRLPDFTCTKVTVRKTDSSGNGTKWKTQDTLEEVVSFAGDGKATYKLAKRNGQPTNRSRPRGAVEDSLIGDALVPLAVFGTKAQAQFRWDHWQRHLDRNVAVIAFEAVGVNTPYDKPYPIKISGKIFFDDAAGHLTRQESTSTGPKGYPLGETRMEVEYAPVLLSDKELILPVKAVLSTNRGKRRYLNEMSFGQYRKYEADIKVTFEDPK